MMNLTLEQWAVVLTAIVALVGLGLSFYNFWQGHPRRRVEVHSVYPLGPGEYPNLISITFINERGPTVVVEEVGFEFPNGRKIVKMRHMPGYDDPLPTEVSAGHSATYCFYLEELRRGVQREGLVFVKAYCRDATGHRYTISLSREIRSALTE